MELIVKQLLTYDLLNSIFILLVMYSATVFLYKRYNKCVEMEGMAKWSIQKTLFFTWLWIVGVLDVVLTIVYGGVILKILTAPNLYILMSAANVAKGG